MTLCDEIQATLEMVYPPVGLPVHRCLIDRRRGEELARRAGCDGRPDEDTALTFLMMDGENLRVAVYYGRELIARLEAEDPRRTISHRNIHSLLAFMEEIIHVVHATRLFRSGELQLLEERDAINQEVQARIDSYWLILHMMRRLTGSPPGEEARAWLKGVIFTPVIPSGVGTARRYRLANRIARRLLRRLEAVPASNRSVTLDHWSRLDLSKKIRLARLG